MHRRACERNHQDQQRAAAFIASRVVKNSQQPDSSNSVDHHFPSSSGVPPDAAQHDIEQSQIDHDAGLTYPDFGDQDTDDGAENPDLDTWNRAPYCSTSYVPKLNDIMVEHHPSITMPTRVMSFQAYLLLRHEEAKVPPPRTKPWAPFQTRMDFDIADFALQARLNKNLTNVLLQLAARISAGEKVSLKNHKNVCDLWEAASHIATPFVKEELSANFETASEHVTYNLSCYVRDTWKWTHDLLEDPLLKGRFHWDAQRMFRWTGSTWERFVSSPWTADRFWEIQSALPEGDKPLAYIIYSDKTRLSSFGTAKGYPVVARIANLDDAVRNSNIQVGGGRVIG